jgi:xylulokinase
MTLVAGADSSTQSCKIVIRDAETGALVRSGRAAHPDGTEVHPEAWWQAFHEAVEQAGGLSDVEAISVAAQQHGMVCLDGGGAVVRPALLWNDLRSAGAAADLVEELGPDAWAQAVGSVPVASFTVTKLRWFAQHEPAVAARTEAVCLPHDWITWRLRGTGDLSDLTTDRGDASGTGYWSPAHSRYREDLIQTAFGRVPLLPTVLGPAQSPGFTSESILIGPGTGDNAAGALGAGAGLGDVVVSIGTSGTIFSVSAVPTADPTGTVAGFADATGRFLPLVCTLNASRVLEAAARMIDVGLDELSRLALAAPAGAGGLTMVPYLDGERTPNRPNATASLHGLTHKNSTPAHLARAAVEGMLCGLADGLDALKNLGVIANRVILIGGGAQAQAVREIAPAIFGCPVVVPEPGEYVADGAAKQAAWAHAGTTEPPVWTVEKEQICEADPDEITREQYHAVRDLAANNQV